MWSFLSLLTANALPLLSKRGRKSKVWKQIPANAVKTSKLNQIIRQKYENRLIENNSVNKSSNFEEPLVLDSLLAQRFVEVNSEKFSHISKNKRLLAEKSQDDATNCNEKTESYPLTGIHLRKSKNIYQLNEDSSPLKDISGVDRGFYVFGDNFIDDYTLGSTRDMPGGDFDDEIDKITKIRYGPDDAVEEIDFQLPGQKSSRNAEQVFDDDDNFSWLENYGTVDASIPKSEHKCGGCAANFHCKHPSLPGFLPVELFFKVKKYEEQLCRRCYMLKKHNFLLNVNVCEVDYRSLMDHLKLKHEALILMIVDLLDMPASILADLPDIIGHRKPVIIIGNKVDLLPPDAKPGFLRHYRDVLNSAVKTAGLLERFNVLHTALISAKTGYGVEDLISNIFLRFSTQINMRNDMYMVGCTNVGKSTLFNAFLQSDLCKVRALDLVERATTSVWPGTTISLLKFPVMNPTPHKLEIRRRRLLANKAWVNKERRINNQLLIETGDSRFATLHAYVGNSFKEREDELQPPSLESVLSGEDEEKQIEDKKKVWDPELYVFAKGKWCYDTPGTVNTAQALNLLTLDELIDVIPRKMILPRTFIVHPDESLLLAGVAQIDLLSIAADENRKMKCNSYEHRPAILCTVFASERLPIFVKQTCEASVFREKYIGTKVLVVPSGDNERISKFPCLEGDELSVRSDGREKGCVDIMLSSFGWICVTASPGDIQFRVLTPAKRGIALRQPPILPFCAQLRGSRIAGTAAYRIKPVSFPERTFERKNKGRRKSWK